jgi:hypothetical protein
MKVPFAACLVIGALVLGCALASVVIRAAEPCWRLLCIPPNTFLAMGLVSVGVITFFGFLAYGTEPEDMRTAIAVALVAVYLILVGESAFFGYLRKSVTLDPLTQAMITSFTTIVGIVIPTYFGASAYTQTRDARRTEVERERDALRREVEELRAIQRGEGPGGREGAT